jgi:hypothetical protein
MGNLTGPLATLEMMTIPNRRFSASTVPPDACRRPVLAFCPLFDPADSPEPAHEMAVRP